MSLETRKCAEIYIRLEKMTKSLAGYAGIIEDELNVYFIPLCQRYEHPNNPNCATKPEPINTQTAMRQFVRSLQNSGRKSRLIGLNDNHNLENDLANDEILGGFNPEAIIKNRKKGSARWEKRIADIINSHKQNKIENLTDKPMYQEYIRGVVSAAIFLDNESQTDGLKKINDAISYPTDKWTEQLWRNELGSIPNALREGINSSCTNTFGKNSSTGLGPALVRDFLKECGCVWLAKPDVHVVEVLREIGLVDKYKRNKEGNIKVDKSGTSQIEPYASEAKADAFCKEMFRFANCARIELNDDSITPYKIDKMIWLICTGNFYLEDRSEEHGAQEDGIHSHRDILIRYLNKTGAA